MRRSTPRPVAAALDDLLSRAEPATALSRVQACWAEAVGPAIAGEAEPVAERAGVLTVACGSAVWAHELELLRGELLSRLNAALAECGSPPLSELRVRTGGGPDGRSGLPARRFP